MLSGKKFRLKTATLGVETVVNSKQAVEVPAGEAITVLYGPKPDDRMLVDVRWRDRALVMFAEDIQRNGQPIGDSWGAGA
jgi:hypothetical protein